MEWLIRAARADDAEELGDGFDHVIRLSAALDPSVGGDLGDRERGRDGDGMADVVDDGMGHDLVQNGGQHTTVDHVFPSLEFSSETKFAEGFVVPEGDLHSEANWIERAAGKTISIIG